MLPPTDLQTPLIIFQAYCSFLEVVLLVVSESRRQRIFIFNQREDNSKIINDRSANWRSSRTDTLLAVSKVPNQAPTPLLYGHLISARLHCLILDSIGFSINFNTSTIFEASIQKAISARRPLMPTLNSSRTSGLNADYIMSGHDMTNPTQTSAIQILFVKYRVWGWYDQPHPNLCHANNICQISCLEMI